MFRADVRGLKTKMTEWTPSFIHKCIISNSCFFTLSFSTYYNTDLYMNAWHFVNAYLSTFSFTPSPLLLLPLSLSFIRYCGKFHHRTLESCSRLTQNHKAILWFIDSAVKSRCVLFFIRFVQKQMVSGKYRDYTALWK